MEELGARAGLAQTKVALEIVDGFDLVKGWGLPNVGVNLDVGHLYLPANRESREEAGDIGDLIRYLGETLLHLHLLDVNGETDHLEVDTGVVPFEEMAAALRDIGDRLGATLELNPDQVTPEGIRRSLAYLRRCLGARERG
jgi:sugar phosphate isomerase/epimerase